MENIIYIQYIYSCEKEFLTELQNQGEKKIIKNNSKKRLNIKNKSEKQKNKQNKNSWKTETQQKTQKKKTHKINKKETLLQSADFEGTTWEIC
jgi:protein required for attachment to host cells